MNIPEHRKAIDKLNAQIVKLLNERTQHVLGIGEAKLKPGGEIYVPHRERAVLGRVVFFLRRLRRQTRALHFRESARVISEFE